MAPVDDQALAAPLAAFRPTKATTMSITTLNLILAWTLAAFFVLGGAVNVAGRGSTIAEYRRWGYPDWFHFVTGALEFATALLLALTTIRLLGAGLGAAVMLAAAATVIVHCEYARAVPPIVVLILLVVVGWSAL
jgi:hypothetical protein